MTYETLLLDRDGGVATLTLNRPDQLNALSTTLLTEINRALDELSADTPRVLVMTGAGRAFCSGADLGGGGLPEDLGALLETHYNPLIEKLWALPCPVVAAVNGPAAGAGCSIALAADFVVAASSAYFLQAFVNIGLVPDAGATWLLPRLAGRARATQMMMLGERVPAAQALDWGMIYKVVDDAALPGEAAALAARLAKGPTRTYALIRQGIRAGLDSSLSDSLGVERVNQRDAGRSGDFAEGVQAFLAKRPAAFTGR